MARIRILKQEVKQTPKVIFTTKAIKQLCLFMSSTHAQTKEFLFLGYVTKQNGDFLIEDFFLVPQEKCSATYCETDDNKYPDWIAKNVPINKRKQLRIHGHSHVNMMTAPSGTDDTQLLRLIDEVDDYFIQLIINHNMNYKVNIWLKEENIIIEDPELYIKINNLVLSLQQGTLPKISEGNYQLKNNIIKFKEGLKLDLEKNKLFIEDDNLEYIMKKTTTKEIIKPKISKEEKEEINKQMNTFIKQVYTYTSANVYNHVKTYNNNNNYNSTLLDYEDNSEEDFYGSEYKKYYES